MAKKEFEFSKQDTFEFNVDTKDAIIVQRQFLGKTTKDIEIESQPVPVRPPWLYLVIKLIRFYQKRVSNKLGNRCVFDPSCSHFAEMAFRKKGFFKGTVVTLKRLARCRPKNGGIDELI